MAGLSKSRIMSSLQCLKRVHLEIHRKDLLEYSKATERSFAIGHEVGDIAIRLYGRESNYGQPHLSQKKWGQLTLSILKTKEENI